MLHIKSYVKLWQPIKNDPSGIFISLTKVSNSADKKGMILENKVLKKLKLPKNVSNQKVCPWIDILQWKIRKTGMIFDIENWTSNLEIVTFCQLSLELW